MAVDDNGRPYCPWCRIPCDLEEEGEFHEAFTCPECGIIITRPRVGDFWHEGVGLRVAIDL